VYEGAKIMLKFYGASSWRDIKDYFRRGRGKIWVKIWCEKIVIGLGEFHPKLNGQCNETNNLPIVFS
jgi:hypothetical protein